MRKQTVSFGHAWEGLIWAVKTQPNFKIHIFFSFCAVVGALILNCSRAEWIIIVTLIFIGLTVEAINTALEETADAIDTKWREDIKHIKDIAAGAMLIYSLGALTIALLIFIPKILTLLF